MQIRKKYWPITVLAVLAFSALAAFGVREWVSYRENHRRLDSAVMRNVQRRSTAQESGKSVTTPPSADEAARLLTQATFGPRLSEIQALQASTISNWIARQQNETQTPPTYYLPYVQQRDAALIEATNDYPHFYFFREAWVRNSLYAPDQLRQRVAFALSQIMVVSERGASLGDEGHTLAAYYDILVRNAFGNYRALLREVTLSPAMGRYLSMYKNRKADAATGVRPDENYAREVLQLFSIGLVQLNNDGTVKLDGQGKPIPTYNQDTISGFAKVFTGWACSTQTRFTQYDDCDEVTPMKAFDDYHEPGSKQLLVYPGTTGLIPGGTAVVDLDAAMDNIFNHPNVGPFISKQLIQKLVTSNPTPAYVNRVANVFNNNGSGVRGDLGAVVRAILVDDEARNGHISMPNRFGKVREPILRFTHVWRVYNANSQSGYMPEWGLEDDIGQFPLRSPSVFNFYSPSYQPNGELTTEGMVSPELQLATDSLTVSTTNELFSRIFYAHTANTSVTYAEWPLINVEGEKALAQNDPDAFIERVDTVFLNGQMSPELRAKIRARIDAIGTWTDSDRFKLQNAVFLAMASAEYQVQR